MTPDASNDLATISDTLLTGDSVQLRESFDLAPVGMALLGSDGRIIRANHRLAALLGETPAELVASHWTRFATPRDLGATERALAEIVAGGRKMLGSPEFSFHRRDGTVVWFRASTTAIRLDPDLQPSLLVQITDLGDERRARNVAVAALERHARVERAARSSVPASIVVDADGTIVVWPPVAEELLGWGADDVVGQPMEKIVTDGGAQLIRGTLGEVLEGREFGPFASGLYHRNGELVPLTMEASTERNAAGEITGMGARIKPRVDRGTPDDQVARLTAEHRVVARVRTLVAEQRDPAKVEDAVLQGIVGTLGTPFVAIGELRDNGESMRVRTGTGWNGTPFSRGSIPVDSTLVGHAIEQGKAIVIDHWTEAKEQPTGPDRYLDELGLHAAVAVPIKSGGETFGGIGVFNTEPRAWHADEVAFLEDLATSFAEAQIRWRDETERRHMELHDPLTGLPTRTLLLDRLSQALERDRAAGEQTAVLVLDVDHFKYVNDTLGHEAGDRLLRAMVPRLQSVVRAGDTVARLSGDEFAIVVGELGGEQQALDLAEQIIDVFTEPFVAGGEEQVVSVSVGVTVAAPAAEPQELLSDADAAAFRAKELGRNRVEVFEQEIRDRVTRRLKTERELRGAVEREELSLRYQPIVDLRSGMIEGFEALVRWQHPQRGLVGPGEFIEIAEESGLIVGLGDWVLQTACAQAAEWVGVAPPGRPLKMSVNLSARQLGDGNVERSVAQALEDSGLSVTSLALEVTESVLIEQQQAVATLTRLRDAGVQIMLDDFGTGYSSLSYLRRFEVDALKIDRSFVADLGQHRQDALLVSALVQMASALNIAAVAEGVETAEQAQLLRMLGCGLVQGFHFARPLTAGDAADLLARGGVLRGGQP